MLVEALWGRRAVSNLSGPPLQVLAEAAFFIGSRGTLNFAAAS